MIKHDTTPPTTPPLAPSVAPAYLAPRLSPRRSLEMVTLTSLVTAPIGAGDPTTNSGRFGHY
jgi:hypothetical protein